MKVSYLHLDVFADRPFRGNQLAVFPEAMGLDGPLMQRIAQEMAFAETTFVFPPESDAMDMRVRIFTPSRELPMAGHPTIGTVFGLAEANRIAVGTEVVTLGLGVGPTPVYLEWTRGRLSFAWMKQPAPIFGYIADHVDRLAAALGIDARDIQGTRLPVQQVSSGVPFLFVPLVSREAVDRAKLDRAAALAFFAANGGDELPLFVFSVEPGDDDATAYSRMFAPLFGIPEDPATGGASGPLGAYLLRHGAVTRKQAKRMVSLQGVAMGRPSRIAISVTGSDESIDDVRVGGTSVSVASGTFEIGAYLHSNAVTRTA